MRTTLVLCLLSACADPPPCPPPPPPGTVNAAGPTAFTANGRITTQPMVDAVLNLMEAEQAAQFREPSQTERLYEHLATSDELYQQALAAGLHEEPEVKIGLSLAAREYLGQIHLERLARKTLTPEAVQKLYEQRLVQYARPSVHARHILVSKLTEANELLQALRAGGDFARLAAEHSQDPGSAQQGGDLGWFTADQMIDSFSEVAFQLEPGTVSEPVETQFGYHLIEVLGRREGTPLDEVRPEIEKALMEQAMERHLAEIRTRLDIKRGG